MHEWALAESVVQTVKNTLDEHPGAQVRCVRVLFGELQAIDPVIFQTGLVELLGPPGERPFEPEAVELETEHAEFRCAGCGTLWEFGDVEQ